MTVLLFRFAGASRPLKNWVEPVYRRQAAKSDFLSALLENKFCRKHAIKGSSPREG
jgi:hypothetical protein